MYMIKNTLKFGTGIIGSVYKIKHLSDNLHLNVLGI
jgi:hypothetical protein